MLSYKQFILESEGTFHEVLPAAAKSRKADVSGTAIEHRGNHAAYGSGGHAGIDAKIRNDIKKPETNKVYQAANSYSKQHLGKEMPFNATPAHSSLHKQYAIAHAYELATSGHPEYKRRVFEAYKTQRPDIIKQTGATHYDDLVQKSYAAASHETAKQFEASPVRGQYHSGAGNYHHSGELLRDIHAHANMTVFRDSGNPHEYLNKPVGNHGINSNEAFRLVHDYYGHGIHGNAFGPKGEEKAWEVHKHMYSAGAQPAVTAETRMQNSWVNYHHTANTDTIAKMEHVRGLKKIAHAAGDHEAVAAHDAHLRELGSHWNYAKQASVLPPPEMLHHDFNGELPHYLHDLTPKKGTYDSRVDHLGLKKLATVHNTASHLTDKGGQYDHEGMKRDLEHIAKINGYTGVK